MKIKQQNKIARSAKVLIIGQKSLMLTSSSDLTEKSIL